MAKVEPVAIQILDPVEVHPERSDLRGDVSLVDCEGGDPRDVTLSPATLRAYAEAGVPLLELQALDVQPMYHYLHKRHAALIKPLNAEFHKMQQDGSLTVYKETGAEANEQESPRQPAATIGEALKMVLDLYKSMAPQGRDDAFQAGYTADEPEQQRPMGRNMARGMA